MSTNLARSTSLPPDPPPSAAPGARPATGQATGPATGQATGPASGRAAGATNEADHEAAFGRLDAAAAIHDLRAAAFDRFRTLGYPTLRHEEWRSTSVKPIASLRFGAHPSGTQAAAAGADDLAPFALPAHEADTLVFVNGRFRSGLSCTGPLPAGVRLASLAAALADDAGPVREHLGRVARFEDEAFCALNTAFIEDGAVLHLPPGAVLERPVHLLFVSAPGEPAAGGALVTHPRVLITAGPGSRATIIERFVGLGAGPSFTNALTEIVAGDDAVLDHYRVEQENEEALHVSTLCTQQGAASTVTCHTFSLGGRLVRNNVTADLAGEGAHATFNGLLLARGRQHIDNHLHVRHLKPGCTSWEFYKGVLDDRGRGVFSGRIFVAEDAQKTDAKQTNMSLLLSDDARVTSKPQLEIFADDVKCTHGATVGQLEESQLFYLESRGIARAAARSILIDAFANELIAKVRVDRLRQQLGRRLLDRLPTRDRLERRS